MKNYISAEEYTRQMKRISLINKSKQREIRLKQEQDKYKRKLKLPSTTKLMAVYLFIVLNIVLVYAMVAMYSLRDLTYLGALITDVVAQILTFFIYTFKSIHENTKGGIVYDMAMKDINTNVYEEPASEIIQNETTSEDAVG